MPHTEQPVTLQCNAVSCVTIRPELNGRDAEAPMAAGITVLSVVLPVLFYFIPFGGKNPTS